ncbi:hypothetical protein C8J57DRAFT_1255551 [Mycena rebaudengoi]|nr:hypothetical protein C8J57DRAFT_1255551 [Mycena rebaudengoi]
MSIAAAFMHSIVSGSTVFSASLQSRHIDSWSSGARIKAKFLPSTIYAWPVHPAVLSKSTWAEYANQARLELDHGNQGHTFVLQCTLHCENLGTEHKQVYSAVSGILFHAFNSLPPIVSLPDICSVAIGWDPEHTDGLPLKFFNIIPPTPNADRIGSRKENAIQTQWSLFKSSELGSALYDT